MGLAHPPGQAFYALLSALSTFTPYPLWSLNQLSALALALTLYPLYGLFEQLRSEQEKNTDIPKAIPLDSYRLTLLK